jgi:hypothetical protein
MEAHIYLTNGDIVQITPHNGEFFTFQDLSIWVGGEAIAFPLPANNLMILDNKGKVKDKPWNANADRVFRNYINVPNDYIVGNVIICDAIMIK